MQVKVKVFRFNPENGDKKPHFQDFTVEADPKEKVLDLLHRIKWEQDGTLSFRRSCAHGICGSCAMKINGANMLACEANLANFRDPTRITVEPLQSLPILKDLVVDLTDFFKKYEIVKPYLINRTPPPSQERLQSPEDRSLIDEATWCILCAACTTSCPSNWKNPQFLGPAALLKSYRYCFDTRDEGISERIHVLDNNDGVWRCHTIFNCVEACPKEINITWHISQLEKKLVSREY
ncbi:MAG: succinate dehydrogenase iron-sulfur subunit [Calditrichota bacterium]